MKEGVFVYKVCRLSELEEKKPLAFRFQEREVGLIRVQDDVYAYENTCPHFGGPVCLGEVFGKIELEMDELKRVKREVVSEETLHLVCPWHGYEFDLRSGECVFDPKLKLRRYPVTVQGEDVYVHLDDKGEEKR
jgi:nitrite reductase/ring-hydroxylating ferredoxin subunit